MMREEATRRAHIREPVAPAALSGAAPVISIVIPAHNEEHRISATLRDYARNFGGEAEFVVVLNGCTDGTEAVVRGFVESDRRFHAVTLRSAVGKGGAVRSGFAIAHAPVVGYIDADGSTNAAEFKRLIAALEPADAVIGSRWMRGADVRLKQPLLRQVASRVFNACVRVLFGLPFADTQCGAKVFRRSALRNIDGSIETANFAFDVDLLFALRRSGARIREVPTVWNDRSDSTVRLASTSMRMLASILRLRLRHSIFRVIIPLFDRLMGTHAMRTNRGLRVLFVNWRDVRHPRAGGAEAYVHEIAKRLVAKGHRVELLTAGYRDCAATETIDGVRVHRVGNAATAYFLAPWYYARRLRDRFDVIVDSENGVPFFTPLFSLKPKVLLVHHVHRRVFMERLPFPLGHFFAWIELGLVPRVYRHVPVVTVSENTREELESHAKTRLPITVVHPGVDERCARGQKSATPTVCYVGRLEPYKRVDLLIAAAASACARVPNLRVVIAGAGSDEERLRALAREIGIDDRVEFRGYVDDETKVRIMREAWLGVFPSSMEGWGITAAETQACGTPAIAFDVPGLREVIRDRETGRVLEELGPDALSAAMCDLLENEEERTRYGRNAFARGNAFSWDNTAEQFYQRLLEAALDQPFHLLQEDQSWHVVARSTPLPTIVYSGKE